LDIGRFNRSTPLAQYKENLIPFARSNVRPGFKAKARGRNGKPIRSTARLYLDTIQLYYEVPWGLRTNRIPVWYPTHIGIPKYYFRMKGSHLSRKQKIISMLARLYYAYRFSIGRSTYRTNLLIKVSRCGDIPRLFSFLRRGNWITISQMVFRRLKVLLCPYRAWNE
jgi:hypothetical protein